MKQIIHIHGWDCYRNEEDFCKSIEAKIYEPFKERKRRINRLREKLAGEYEMFAPDMPLYQNATYKPWKIWFEKIFPFLNGEELIITGSSLWVTFLAKYLSENKFPLPIGKKINQLHLIAWVFDRTDLDEEDYLADFIFDPTQLKHLEQQVDKIFLYHSKDDPSVPFSHVEKFKFYLPNAILTTFDDRWHFFNQSEFPEVLQNIIS